MKKFIYSLSVFALMLTASACGNGNRNAETDSLSDSAMVETADSATTEEATEVNPEEVLSVSVEKKNLDYLPESSFKSGSMTVKVTNNGKVSVKGADYVVTYDEIIEDWVGTPEDGGLADVTKKRTAEGKDVTPGESVQIVLKSTAGCQDLKNPAIKNVK